MSYGYLMQPDPGGVCCGCDQRSDPCAYCTPKGACCVVTSCSIKSSTDCSASGGSYQGDGSTCSPNPCLPPTGACCYSSMSCSDGLTNSDCTGGGGTYLGNTTTCAGAGARCYTELGGCCHAQYGYVGAQSYWCSYGGYSSCFDTGTPSVDFVAGTFLGFGVDCTVNVSCGPPLGACCKSGGPPHFCADLTSLTDPACTYYIGTGISCNDCGYDYLPTCPTTAAQAYC